MVGWGLIALGLVSALAALAVLRRRAVPRDRAGAAAAICLVVAAGATPYVLWRVGEDLRYTTRLHGYDVRAAGPVQAYLPGYLVDGAASVIPVGSTYATVVSPRVRWATARKAFPPLALTALFPRRSVAEPRDAEFVVTWGIEPRRVTRVSKAWLIRPRAGAYPAVLVGKVAH
jgi:hypothetical protein